MAELPPLDQSGALPAGVHRSTLEEVAQRFGQGSVQRHLLIDRLRRIHRLAIQTGHLKRFILFGSFVTAAAHPQDVDIFLVMDDSFQVSQLQGAAAIPFNHRLAQAWLGASVFWMRSLTALGGEETAIEQWQITRNGTHRGIVEVVADVEER